MLRAVKSSKPRSYLLTSGEGQRVDGAMVTLLIVFLVALVLIAGYLLFFAH
jgi:hypothetical protein